MKPIQVTVCVVGKHHNKPVAPIGETLQEPSLQEWSEPLSMNQPVYPEFSPGTVAAVMDRLGHF